MKLILKEYLASLKEREELDALLPDLLSQMGLNVISKPGRGTRQFGVDIAAVGKINGGPEKVYLLSVKSGDLGRKDWNSGSVQDLQPSLDDILTVYIPTHIPTEHKDKPIAICICMGGDIKEEVRISLSQYEKSKITDKVEFEIWDGDRLSSMVENNFLQEDLLPQGMRPLLRKSLALLDEPQASFKYFSELVKSLSSASFKKNADRLTAMRQMNICLWILFAWARDIDNMESAYLSSERVVLHAWELCKKQFHKKTKIAQSMQLTYSGIVGTYQEISGQYLSKVVIPHASKMHGLSSSVRSSESLDVNLKLFDLLSRLSIAGLWSYWSLGLFAKDDENTEQIKEQVKLYTKTLKLLISNNPILFLPAKDSQAIDIFLAMLFLSFDGSNEEDCIKWLTEMHNRIVFSYEVNGAYPCIYDDYNQLILHPENGSDEYKKDATSASILYPTMGLWAALLKNKKLYELAQKAFEDNFSHCNYQFWYVGNTSEDHLYINDQSHGASLSHLPINLSEDEFLDVVWDECDQSDNYKKLSCFKNGLWPLLLIACRHYRLPVPVNFTLGYRDKNFE